MLTEPKIVTRAAQPFAAIVLTLRQPEIAQKAPPLVEDVIAWVRQHGGQPAGAPYFNYVNFLPGGTMEMQVGVPTEAVLKGDGKVTTGTLPGGRFASMTLTGPYQELHDVNMKLGDWARQAGYNLDGEEESDRFVGATRMEIYHTDPGIDPSGDPVTEVAFRLAQ